MKLILWVSIFWSSLIFAEYKVLDPVFAPPDWTSGTRPTCPSNYGCFGYNTDLNKMEIWNGTDWVVAGSGNGDVVGPIVSVVDRAALFADITGKLIKETPYTLPMVVGAPGDILTTDGAGVATWLPPQVMVIVEDSLTSTSTVDALSANQGKILDDKIAVNTADIIQNTTDIASNTLAITGLQADTHTHANKALLDSLTSTGAGDQFLSDDGTYKTVPIVLVEDSLTSTSTVDALSANQGKILNDMIVVNTADIASNTTAIAGLEANTHTHANKILLDSLTSTGTGAAFLSDDGTYKDVPVSTVHTFKASTLAGYSATNLAVPYFTTADAGNNIDATNCGTVTNDATTGFSITFTKDVMFSAKVIAPNMGVSYAIGFSSAIGANLGVAIDTLPVTDLGCITNVIGSFNNYQTCSYVGLGKIGESIYLQTVPGLTITNAAKFGVSIFCRE